MTESSDSVGDSNVGVVSASGEEYPAGRWHCVIHLNPETGELRSDGDHRVRYWLQFRLNELQRQRMMLEVPP